MLKKIIIILLGAATIFTACKKNQLTALEIAQQRVLGKWSYVSFSSITYTGGVISSYKATITAADYVDIRTDGKAYDFKEGVSTISTYSLLSDKLMKINQDTAQMQILSDSLFVLHLKKYSGTDSSDIFTTLKK